MPTLFSEVISRSPSQVQGSYIYSVLPIARDGLAALTSADELLFLDKSNLTAVSRQHADMPRSVSCMTDCENAENIVICAGGDGVVAMFDSRSQQRVSQFKIDRAVTALAHHNHEIAVGSELSHSHATISTWDQRKIQVRWQSSENNDDITTLQYHPSRDEQLLSGGDDGLVSLFDTSIPEEDDSMIEAFNFAPVHKTGYLSDMAIYALSADQKFSIYPVNSSQFDGSDVNQPVSFGDLRPIVKCNYVIDVLRDAHQPYIVTGSNLSDTHVDFIPLIENPIFSLSSENVIRLQGAHGEEIVRSVCLDKPVGTIFTAGEDGFVKGFRAATDPITVSPQPVSSKEERKKGKSERFRPY